MSALCPYCNAPVSSLNISQVNGAFSPSDVISCLVYACPTCHKVLNATLDSTQIRASIIEEIRNKPCCP